MRKKVTLISFIVLAVAFFGIMVVVFPISQGLDDKNKINTYTSSKAVIRTSTVKRIRGARFDKDVCAYTIELVNTQPGKTFTITTDPQNSPSTYYKLPSDNLDSHACILPGVVVDALVRGNEIEIGTVPTVRNRSTSLLYAGVISALLAPFVVWFTLRATKPKS